VQITRNKLANIIKEEIRSLLAEKQPFKAFQDNKQAFRRKTLKDVSDQRKTEEDDELEEDNPYRAPDTGYFTDEESAGCKSSYFKDGERVQMKGGKPRSLTHKHNSGRGRSYTGSGTHRCRDNSRKNETILEKDKNGKMNDTERRDRIFPGSAAMRSLSYGVVQEVFKDVVIEEGSGKVCMDRSQIKSMRQRMYQTVLRTLSDIQKAEKGEL
tara:strand:+ start:693 stop:1328 length:636 start_codon:yes stop_codon:yes gene_type:complete